MDILYFQTKNGKGYCLVLANVGSKGRFHYEREKEHSLFVLSIFSCTRFNFNRSLQSKINKRNKECSFPRSQWKRALRKTFFLYYVTLRHATNLCHLNRHFHQKTKKRFIVSFFYLKEGKS